jgi:putative ABC transport system permease protein
VKLTKPKVMNFLTPKFKLRTSGNIRTESSTIMRQFLVAIQFFTASLLAIFAWALWLQVHTLKTQTTAHNTEQIVLINSPETTSPDSPQAKLFADSLRSLPQSLLMTYTTGLPSQPHIRFMFYKHSDDTTQLPMNFTSVSSDFLNILNLKLISGQFFSKKQTTTNIKEFVVNRAAAELIGQNSLTDTLFTNFDLKGKIVGVIENFSYDDPNKAIEPMVYTLQSQRTREITLKLKPNTPIPYTEICKINQYFFPGYPLEIKPLISQMAKYYQKEETLFTFFLISATLAFIIAILGLFGLTSYIVSQHQKSISIRKMLGSSNTQIIQLLTAQILPWLLTFTLSTWPLSRIILGLWYQHADIRLPLYWYSTLGFPLLISLLATIIVSLYTGIAAHKKSKTITIYE